ncbi:cerebellin-1-like [Engraulis encrasicolus]|uniref:cerebellin-1-like n=1 Tax=Engraulis encrasicolus TaxID=184585 RepID=UPI002FD03A0B
MRAVISLLVLLLLSMCGTDASTQDISNELKQLRDMVVDLTATLKHTQDDVKVLQTELGNLKKENALQEAELAAVNNRLLAATEKDIRAAPKVAFSAALRESDDGYTRSGSDDLNIAFKKVFTNVGEAYSNTTGFFTAPVRGVYYFRFTVADKLSSRWMTIKMNKNGQQIMFQEEYAKDEYISYLSGGLVLQLEKGDTVNMVLRSGRNLYDYHEFNYNTFSGFLLFPL